MGIKGRRVHMIEQLSETIISFQRVQPAAKERLVQITGPNEEKILYASQLIEETIRSNTSPVPDFVGSNFSLNSVESEEEPGHKTIHLPTYNLAENEYQFKHKVSINDEELIIIGKNYNYVMTAKNVLDEFFSKCDISGNSAVDIYDDDDVFHTLQPEKRVDIIVPKQRTSVIQTQGDGIYGIREKSFEKIIEQANMIGKQNLGGGSHIPGKKCRKYSIEFMLKCRKSPLSQEAPQNYLELVKRNASLFFSVANGDEEEKEVRRRK